MKLYTAAVDPDFGHYYDDAFYRTHHLGTSRSASLVLGRLYTLYQPRSVIDVGCGQGAWLAAAQVLGASSLVGLDGPWVDKAKLLSQDIDFRAVQMENRPPQLDRTFDLCISLEVAEHLPEVMAKPFVDFLCDASEVVLFSAAIPHQGGTRHLNEQWQSYWIDLFARRGYQCMDIFRAAFWSNQEVEWWYRQNMFLFVSPSQASIDWTAMASMVQPVWDVAHPQTVESKAMEMSRALDRHERPTWRYGLRCMKISMRNHLRRILGM